MNYQSITLASYNTQVEQWPDSGQHIMAQYDDNSIVVYQAYRPEIGHFAVKHQYFGGAFSLSRMSWIKPNFLWMMYRSDWGRTQGQEVILAIRIDRIFFNQVVSAAITSQFDPATYKDNQDWKKSVDKSDVRSQWDPDHDPVGAKCTRRAIQLGLRGDTLKLYSNEAIIEIIDMSEFVAEQRENAQGEYNKLFTPVENIYPIT